MALNESKVKYVGLFDKEALILMKNVSLAVNELSKDIQDTLQIDEEQNDQQFSPNLNGNINICSLIQIFFKLLLKKS